MCCLKMYHYVASIPKIKYILTLNKYGRLYSSLNADKNFHWRQNCLRIKYKPILTFYLFYCILKSRHNVRNKLWQMKTIRRKVRLIINQIKQLWGYALSYKLHQDSTFCFMSYILPLYLFLKRKKIT